MKLSTRSTYGLRAMVALAMAYGQGPVLLRDIAGHEHLPMTYLEQIMVPLRKASLVSATRGANGGYTLTRSPDQISLANVITALEGPLQLVDCDTVASCTWHKQGCALRDVLLDASNLLIEYFSCISLSDLACRQCNLLEKLKLDGVITGLPSA